MSADWTRVFDAVIHTDRMFPASLSELPAEFRTAKQSAALSAGPLDAALETFRVAVAGYGLGMDSVFPKEPITGFDAKRVDRLPAGAFPEVLGRVEAAARRYETFDGAEALAAPPARCMSPVRYASNCARAATLRLCAPRASRRMAR